MKITPVEINKQEFKKILRGYDPVEVDTFLEMIGTEFEQLLNDNKSFEKKITQLETELKNYKEVERTLKQTLMNVQETSTKSRENSLKEAGLIKKEAEITASEMVESARHETHKLGEELMMLRSQKESLISRLRHILSSHLELLEVLNMDDAEVSALKDRTKKVFSGTKMSIKKEAPASKSTGPAVQKKVDKISKAEPKKETVQPEKNVEKKEGEKLHGPDLFKDIFGDSTDMDDYIKS